ncbi:MAG: phosphoglycerate kinase [Candidatus Harrisonbacteria bacterium]|nr:phosphoglycerate kinase [Candidatus Harrisonbacteria bacterium]
MIQYLRNLKNSGLSQKVCLLRLDFNTDDNWRLKASLPTIKFLLKKCRAVVILSHKGRPDGFAQKLSLRPVIADLKKELKKPAVFLPHFRFQEIANLIKSSPQGSLFLLENLRFLKGETENSQVLAEHLAMLGDFYVNDAFAVSHRANASVVAITKFLPSYAGLELEAEIKNLSRVMKNPKKPLVIILGGLKIEDKLGVVKNLKNKAAAFLIGGALTPEILKLKLPKVVWPADFKKDKQVIRDIGPKSAELFCKEILKAKTIVWNGPLGNILDKRFQNGTKRIAQCLSDQSRAFKIIGGGETVMFLKKMKLAQKINFISTGGGAMLDFLAGKKLPGIEALK